MQTHDAEKFKNLMLGMADNFRDSISKEGMRLRWEMLKTYSIEQIEAACMDIMRRRKYTKMPPIAEFIESIEGQSLSDDMLAEQQWSEIMGQIRSVGSYSTPRFSDPVTLRLLNSRFSWLAFCQATETELRFLRKEFIAAYGSESKHDYARISGRMKKLIANIGAEGGKV